MAQVIEVSETVQAVQSGQVAPAQQALPPSGAIPSNGLSHGSEFGTDRGSDKTDTGSTVDLDLYRQQVNLLHSRIRALTVLLIGVTLTLGGSLAWSVWQRPQPNFSTAGEAFHRAVRPEPGPQIPSSAP